MMKSRCGVLSRHLLGPGLLGLMISGILLGHMPSVGSGAVNFSAMFTRNLYEPMFPGKSTRHYMLVAKLSIIGILVAGILGALLFKGILSLWGMLVSLAALGGSLGFLMLFWRKFTADAAGVGWGIWILLLVFLPWILPMIPAFRQHPALTLQTMTQEVVVAMPATQADVDAHRAVQTKTMITSKRNIAPVAIFFESTARIYPNDPDSSLEGVGRFHTELFLLYHMGLPLQKWSTPELNTCRWIFDGAGPFFLFVALTYLLPKRRNNILSAQTKPTLDAAAYSEIVMNGNVALLHNPHETPEQEKIRLDRFFAKLKTQVAHTPELDQIALQKTFENPSRFDQQKLFPNSSWEFAKWTRNDCLGFLGGWLGVAAVMGLLWLVLNIGR